MSKRSGSIWLSVFCSLLLVGSAQSQQPPKKPWQSVDIIPQNRPVADVWVQPKKNFHAFNVDHGKLRADLARAPKEFSNESRIAPGEISLPMPDGSFARFSIVESPVMAPELAAKFPEIKTYLGQGIDDPSASVRFDISPAGFHAQILSPNGAVYIDPYWRGDAILHTSYYKRDYRRAIEGFQCLVSVENEIAQPRAEGDLSRSGNNLRIYRLACAATGEYVAFHGGTVSSGMSAIVTAINRVSGVYEVELAIRMVLVANNDLIVYTNANQDPYSNANPSSLLTQNQANLDSVIGDNNYDIGHVFSTGGGGLAALGVVCNSGNKARGETGLGSPIGDPFYIDFVAHEIGHQFSGNHTFNGVNGNCSGANRNASTAYEPGSGSTIQAYAGICGSDNLQPHSDPYFHSISFDEIISFTTLGGGNSCPVVTSTGNTVPTVSAGGNFVIPKSTPFTLTATGNDPDGHTLTYCWEERDLGAAQALSDPDNGSSPIFRSLNPTTNRSRTFPAISNLVNNTFMAGEKLPTTGRTMNFRVTARDNRAGGGGVNTANTQITVNANAGPFLVTFPNSPMILSNIQTVTWNVAGTTSTPINAANVNILLSTNGGFSFPIVLATNTPNDGSQAVVLPSISTSAARVKVEATGNIFFDISDTNFSIAPSAPAPAIVIDSATLLVESCGTGNGAIDPNETVTVSFALKNIGSLNTANLTATLLEDVSVHSPSGPQIYGSLIAGGAAVSNSFSFTASGACGRGLYPVLQLQDGTNNLGTVTVGFTFGSVTEFTVTNSNSANIGVPGSGNFGAASPYPSSINVSGLQGTLTKFTVSLFNFSHAFPDDVDILLVAPDGQTILLMSDAGGSANVNNVTLTFDGSATASLPDATQLVSGTFQPSNYGTDADSFSAPAPAGPYGQTNVINPNGTWSLYIMDDANPDKGSIAGGWQLTLMTEIATCCNDSSNAPPVISLISNQVTEEDFSITNITFTVSDAEIAASSLIVTGNSSNTNLVPNADLIFSGSGTNRLLAVTPLPDQFGSATITVFVDDGTNISSSAFLFTVNSVNDAPILSSISSQNLDEGTLLQFTNSATDIENNPMTFNLEPGVPDGAQINPTNGVFSWTPSEAQGPGTNSITVRVTDNGSPNLSDTETFFVTINEVNVAPDLQSVSNKFVYPGTTLTFTNLASDSDLPANILAFSFEATADGAQINPTNGLFTWTPTEEQLGTNVFTIRVLDDGEPSLDDVEVFSVVVVLQPTILSVTESNGAVTLTWSAIPGQNYRVQYKSDLDQNFWNDLPGDVLSTGESGSKTDSTGLVEQRFYQILVLP